MFEPAQSALYHQFSYAINFQGWSAFYQGQGDTPSAGLSFAGNGATYINIAGDGGAGLGVVPVPIDSTFRRCIKWSLNTWAPVDPFGILDVDLVDRNHAFDSPGIGE
jgi:hypothetical protein